VYYPALFPLEVSRNAEGLVKRLTMLQGKRQGAEEKIRELEKQAGDDALVSELKSINAAYDKFISGLLAPDGEMDGLLILVRAATLQHKLDHGAHWLHLQVQKAGSNVKTETGGILRKSNFVCSGGAVVSYMIVDPDMTVVLSGQEVSYIGRGNLQELEGEKE
jgi:hypothetical protein